MRDRRSGGGERAGAAWGARALRGAFAAALVLAAPSARASCCIFEDPLLAVGEVAARSGALRLALEAEALSSSARSEAHPGMAMDEEVSQASLRVVAVHSPRERLNLVLAVPVVRRSWRLDGGGTGASSAVLSGVGDVDVGARWALWRRVAFVPDAKRVAVTRAQALAIAAGTSLPTGENGAGRDGVRLEEHAQIGTGAFGPYAGLLYQLQREPWSLSSTIIARFRTENRHGYRFGDALLAAADVQREALPWLAVGVGMDVRWAALDREDGGGVASTGGFLVAATPSLSVGLAAGLRARVRAQLPVVQRLRGEQHADPSVLAGISWDGA